MDNMNKMKEIEENALKFDKTMNEINELKEIIHEQKQELEKKEHEKTQKN